MVQTLPISKTLTTLADVKLRFSIDFSTDPTFFTEWFEDLPVLTTVEQQQLDHIQSRFLIHRERASLPEGAVDKLMISPLLDLAGLYDPKFTIRTEASVAIVLEDRGEVLTGRMDTLILRDRLWVLVVEAKNSTFSLSIALPQILTYMLSASQLDQPLFGLITNGEEFRFVKLQQIHDRAIVDLSDILSVMPASRSRLMQVVQVLKGWAIG